MGGTPNRLGCKLSELQDNIEDISESIIEQLGTIQTCFEIDSRRKILFIKFKNSTDKENAKKIYIIYNQKKIEWTDTNEYNSDHKIIIIPSHSGLSVWDVAPAAHHELSQIGEVLDILVLKHKTLDTCPSRSIKISIKTKKENEIPQFLNILDIKVNLTWRGGPKACTYCKEPGHWKNECIELFKKKTNHKRDRISNPRNVKKVVLIGERSPQDKNLDPEKNNGHTSVVIPLEGPIVISESATKNSEDLPEATNIEIPIVNSIDDTVEKSMTGAEAALFGETISKINSEVIKNTTLDGQEKNQKLLTRSLEISAGKALNKKITINKISKEKNGTKARKTTKTSEANNGGDTDTHMEEETNIYVDAEMFESKSDNLSTALVDENGIEIVNLLQK
ncbi:hypothetical protein AYI68_g7507 [Smittium mucronatum]|uniref:CCHC-type domain-containing protein n=1 Tax=Smittium mucronatum TaxID=133383 RepID=A0A1R0GNH6_9FUNG|nr:hypothetical protein AYI68_g7507 [Smittium mucronatum]